MPNISRGKIRVTGIIKTGLLVAFAVASTNRRFALTFDEGQAKPATRRRRSGRPRRHSLTTYREVALDAAASRTVLLTT